MNFGGYLKQLREDKGFTQKQLVARLNLLGGEFQAIDSVTVSRWERGTTSPSIEKSIKVLRQLTNDLLPYLSDTPIEQKKDALKDIAQLRFSSPKSTLLNASYLPPTIKAPCNEDISLLPLFESNEENGSVEALKNFFHSVGIKDCPIFDVDLFQYQRENKIFGRKFVHQQSRAPLGHTLSFFFDARELRRYYDSPFCPFPVKLARSYNPKQVMAICTITRFSSTERVYWLNSQLGPRFIASHANIHDMYFYAIDESSVGYMNDLDAEKVAYDTIVENGPIKIGGQAFKHGLFRVDSARWLARQEIRSLLALRQHESY